MRLCQGVGKKKGERIEGEEDPLMNCRTKEIAATVGLLQVREGEVVQMLNHEMHLRENVHGLQDEQRRENVVRYLRE